MAQKIARLRITREPGYLYFIKDTNVMRVAQKRAGKKASKKKERVGSFNHERDNDYMYFLDKDGDVARAKRKSGGARKRRKGAKAPKRKAAKRKTAKRKTAKRKAPRKAAKRKVASRRGLSSGLTRRPTKRRAVKKAAKKKSGNAVKSAMKELAGMGKRLKR